MSFSSPSLGLSASPKHPLAGRAAVAGTPVPPTLESMFERIMDTVQKSVSRVSVPLLISYPCFAFRHRLHACISGFCMLHCYTIRNAPGRASGHQKAWVLFRYESVRNSSSAACHFDKKCRSVMTFVQSLREARRGVWKEKRRGDTIMKRMCGY